MPYECNGCGNSRATRLRIVVRDGACVSVCDLESCGAVGPMSTPDAYFRKPYFDPHLGGDKNPHGVWVSSRGHKARLMKEQGLRESGDKVHGARNYDKQGVRRVRENKQSGGPI